MNLICVCIDQRFDGEAQCVAPLILKRCGDRLSESGHGVRFFGPWDPTKDKIPAGIDAALVFPAWFSMKEGVVKHTEKFLQECLGRRLPVVVVSDDLQVLEWHWKTFSVLGCLPLLVTNFKEVHRVFKTPHDHFYLPYPPVDQMLTVCTNKDPKFEVAYVGYMKPKRWRMLKDLDFPELVLMGHGWDKQDRFLHCYPGLNRFRHLGELYAAARWHISLQDPWAGQVLPSISRLAEAWRHDRPVLIHRSHVDHRRDIDWSPVMDYVWETPDEARAIMKARPFIRTEAMRQEDAMFNQLYVEDVDVQPILTWIQERL